jgi:hypothetical protein
LTDGLRSRAINVPASVSVTPSEVGAVVVVGREVGKNDAAVCVVWNRNVLFEASFERTMARVEPVDTIEVEVLGVELVSAM